MKKRVGWLLDPILLLVGSYIVSYWLTRHLRGNIKWSLIISEQHIHHWQWAVPGLVLISILLCYFNGSKMRKFCTLAVGIFVGIIFDEYDMWWSDLPSPNDNTHKGFFVGLSLIVLTGLLSKLVSRVFQKPNDG